MRIPECLNKLVFDNSTYYNIPSSKRLQLTYAPTQASHPNLHHRESAPEPIDNSQALFL